MIQLNSKQQGIVNKQLALSSKVLGKNETPKNLINKNMFLDVDFDEILLTKELYSAFSKLGSKPLQIGTNEVIISQQINSISETQKRAVFSIIKNQLNVDTVTVKSIDSSEIVEYLNFVKNDFISLDKKIEYAISHIEENGIFGELVSAIISDAIHLSASDIHIDKKQGALENWISYRIHGVIERKYLLPPNVIAPIFIRLKDMSGMDIAQTNLEMDGQLNITLNGKDLSLRAGYTPLSNGEKITLRIADASKIKSVMANFVDFPEIRSNLSELINVRKGSGGMIVLTGATGSGKTSTLLGLLKSMPRESLNVMTVEDPVEMQIPFVNHIQVNNKAGMTFNRTLKSILRQDPDVILVGELRDTETVEVAIRAADTGHMVLTTLHASSVQGSFNRLMSMLSEEFAALGRRSLANQVKAIINQNLAIKACSHCAIPFDGNDSYYVGIANKLAKYFKVDEELMEGLRFINPKGCAFCNGKGTDGRLLLPEAIFLKGNRQEKSEQERVIANINTEIDLKDLAGVEYYSFEQSCLAMIKAGKLSGGEALRMLESI